MTTDRPQAGPRLAEVLDQVGPEAREVLWGHLLGGTSAEWLASVLTEEGYPISASSIRTQRREWKRKE